MDVAPFFFFTGNLLFMCCGFRVLVRVYRFMQSRGLTQPWDPLSDFLPTRLRDTLSLEIFGLIVGQAMMFGAVPFLR
jgi:hypothetical protein